MDERAPRPKLWNNAGMLTTEQPFSRIAIAGRRNTPELFGPISTLASLLSDRGFQVSLEQETAEMTRISGYLASSAEALGLNHDLVIVIGGDGTMLSFARRLAPFRVPIIGINRGRLGFLTDIPQAFMEVMIGDIVEGSFLEEKRSMLMASVPNESETTPTEIQAINEIVIGRNSCGQVADFSISIDDNFAYSLRADAIIVATPTGSTAYALSAGGPIIAPGLPVFAIVPVAPYGLTHRPIILPNTVSLQITVEKGYDISLHGDAQTQVALLEGERVTIKRSPYQMHLLHPSRYDYFSMLRQKLHWSETPERTHKEIDLGNIFDN